MKKLVFNILCLAFTCGALCIVGNYLFQANNGHYTYHMMNEMYQYNGNIDVVFLGSSHVYRSYDPKKADRLLGCNTYNAGSSSQGMNTSYYLLKEIASYHNISTVYLDTYYGMANIPNNDAQVFLISDFMKDGINKVNLLYSNGGIETLFNGYMSFRHNRNNYNIISNLRYKRLPIDDYSTVTYKNEEYRGEGFVYSYENTDIIDTSTYRDTDSTIELLADRPFSELYLKSLLDIIMFCREKNIELVLVNQPMPRESLNKVLGYDNYVRCLQDIANNNNLEYWNFDLYKYDVGLTMDCYKDESHLNGKGAEIYTAFFCDFVNAFREGNVDVSNVFLDIEEF